jgi:hypothetical protein
MISARMPNPTEVLRLSFPGITHSELRLEQIRIKMGTAYCLLGGAGLASFFLSNFNSFD